MPESRIRVLKSLFVIAALSILLSSCSALETFVLAGNAVFNGGRMPGSTTDDSEEVSDSRAGTNGTHQPDQRPVENVVSRSSSQNRFTVPSSECIRITVAESNGAGTAYLLTNGCSKTVTVMNCFDQTQGLSGECNNKNRPGNGSSLGEWWGGHQGAGDLRPGSSTRSIYVPPRMYFHVRACEIPSDVRWVDIQAVADGGRYSCKVLQ